MPTPSPLNRPARFASTEEVIVGEHLAELRSRVRLLTCVHGLSWFAIVAFGGLLVAGTLDWLLRFEETGTRLIVGIALAFGTAWMVWQHLVVPLRETLTGSFLAARVERRFPEFHNRLISAVEFLEHRLDPKLGSVELQKSVVAQALKDLERVEAADVVETRSIRNVTVSGTLVTMMAMLVVVLHPLEAATSVQRLMFPFSKVPWPRSFELQLIHADLSPVTQAPELPLLIARGDTLEMYVQNTRGRLPERVWFEYRLDDGPVTRETLRHTTIRDDKGRSRETATISWIATRGTMHFRATGGDDNLMPFHRVDVVPPPNIDSLNVTITPPAYSRRLIEDLPPGVGHVQGLVGTKIVASAASDKPLKSAKLRIGERPGIELALSEDRQHFSAGFEIQDAVVSSYWFELTDTLGFTDREAVHYELRGIADGVPDVTIENPVADVMLTADAELPIKILAKDDLGLRDLRMVYQVGDDETIASIPLFNNSRIPQADDSSLSDTTLSTLPILGPQRHEADYLWKMADLRLEPGARIVFRAEATDDYDLGPAHVGKSIPRTIVIGSREEKLQELASRVGELLSDLKQAAQLQQRAHQQTEELRTQLEKVGELRSQDLDQLQRTELDQRQATSRLTNTTDGVETKARELLDDFRGNHLTDGGTEERLERIATELERLDRDVLPETERALTQAQKLAEKDSHEAQANDRQADLGTAEEQQTGSRADQHSGKVNNGKSAQNERTEPGHEASPNTDATDATNSNDAPNAPLPKKVLSATEKALAEAQSRQAQTMETLTELQESLAEWRDRRDVSRDFESVISEQESIQHESAEMAQRTMTKSAAELTKQDKAELKKLATRQRKVADQLEQFRKQLEQTANSLQKSDADTAEKFSEAGQELKNRATNGKLQDAAQDIADNKMGSAVEAQQEAMNELHEVERMMKRQPQDDTEQFLKQTQNAQQDIQQLRQEQESLADQAEQLAKQPDSQEKQDQLQELMEQQEELIERMAKAERKLERLRMRSPAEAMNRARKRLTEMVKDAPEAQDGEELQQAMDESLDDLEQVERELALEKRVAQERLAFEQLEKIEDELRALRTQQEAVLEETMRLDGAMAEREALTRGQLKTLKELAESERSLQHAAEQMRDQMAAAEVFSLVLKRLARTLNLAADRLGERETGLPIQTLERDAIRKIDSLLTVLEKEQTKPEKSPESADKPEGLGQEPQEQEDKPEDAQPPGDTIPQLAQLKLLKAMQEEYLERTAALDQFRDQDGHLPEAMQSEKNELAREQAELADFARNLMAKLQQQKSQHQQPDEPKPKPDTKPQAVDPDKIDL